MSIASRSGPECPARADPRQKSSEPPHQRHKTPLNFDAVRPEDPGLVCLVGRFQRNRCATAAQPFQSDLFIINEGNDNGTIFGSFAALDDDRVTVEDPGIDHAVTRHLERVVLAAAAEHARRYTDRRGLVAQCLDRRAGGYPAIKGQLRGRNIRGDRRAWQRTCKISADHGRREAAAFAGHPSGAFLWQLYHLQGPGTMRQPPDESALFEAADEAMNAGF